MDALEDFLRERIDEQEAIAGQWPDELRFRMLTEVGVFRTILADYVAVAGRDRASPHRQVLHTTCMRLASIWVRHPDYRALILTS